VWWWWWWRLDLSSQIESSVKSRDLVTLLKEKY
jgi:hypothetical protein